MEPRQLFLNSLNELASKQESMDEYDVLSISRLLRLLLDDGQPLVHQVNRTHRLPLTFRIGRSTFPPSLKPDTWSLQDGFDPDTSRPGKPSFQVSLDGMLAEVIAGHNGTDVSVLEVIKYEAHVGGGVHAGRPRGEAAETLHDMNQSVSIGGYTPTLRQLKSIARVVLKGLAGLGEAVTAEMSL